MRIAFDSFIIFVGLSAGISISDFYTHLIDLSSFFGKESCSVLSCLSLLSYLGGMVSVGLSMRTTSCIIRSIRISSLKARALPREWSAAFIDTAYAIATYQAIIRLD